MTDRDIARSREREQEVEALAATLEDVIGQCVENLAHRKVGA